MNREQWLHKLAAQVKPIFDAAGSPLDLSTVRLSVGWPGGASPRKRIGECWSSKCSASGLTEIFVSPILGEASDVDHVVVHELVHAVVGVLHGHKAPFVRVARAVGLEGKPTATHAGPELRQRLDAICSRLGPYPHAALVPMSAGKKQSTRMLKMECEDCGYVARTTAKWIEYGLPTCACGGAFKL